MDAETFNQIFDELTGQMRHVLVEKAKEYADDTDRLHNFQIGASFVQGTPEQALWGFLVKHLVSISDMVKSGKYYHASVWDEKIGDALNYLVLLRAQVYESDINRAHFQAIADQLSVLEPQTTNDNHQE